MSLSFTELMRHAVQGTHGVFTGRRYRRGRNRCAVCGAPVTALSDPMVKRSIEQSIMDKNRLIQRLRQRPA